MPFRLLPLREMTVQSLDIFFAPNAICQECDSANVVRSLKGDTHFYLMTLKGEVA